jgi:hypothetical protein
MRKKIRYTVLLIPLLVLIGYLIKDRSPFGSGNTSFNVTPKNEITDIEFSDGTRKLHLEKDGDEWIVDNKYETRKSSILFILKILTEMQIKSPVAPEMFQSEIVEKKIDPVRVKVSEKGRTLRTFLVYKTPSNIYGNIMKLKEDSKPFIVYVPGSEVEIGSAFTMNQLFWQPYTIFSYMPSEIASATLINSTDSSSSFSIRNLDHTLHLFSLGKELSGWDTSRVERYLSYYTHVPFESWAFDLPAVEQNNIMNKQPLYTIRLVLTSGESQFLDLWGKEIEEDGIIKLDTDRLWGKMNYKNELFVVRYVDIDPLLKKLSYFFPK